MLNNKMSRKDVTDMLSLLTTQNKEILNKLSLLSDEVSFLADRQRKEDLVIRKVV
jgi:hypothetical protein